jgi:hypothetical protein
LHGRRERVRPTADPAAFEERTVVATHGPEASPRVQRWQRLHPVGECRDLLREAADRREVVALVPVEVRGELDQALDRTHELVLRGARGVLGRIVRVVGGPRVRGRPVTG